MSDFHDDPSVRIGGAGSGHDSAGAHGDSSRRHHAITLLVDQMERHVCEVKALAKVIVGEDHARTTGLTPDANGVGRDLRERLTLMAANAGHHLLSAPEVPTSGVNGDGTTVTESVADQTQQLRMRADRWKLLTDVAPIGVFLTDVENNYVYTNARWSEITGISQEEAIGTQLDTTVASGLRSDIQGKLSNPGMGREEFSHRFEVPQVASPPRVARITAVPLTNSDGEILGWAGTVADISAEADAEVALAEARDAATAASRLKSEFLANMSHEIRTPMNGVIGMSDLLLGTDLDVRQRDYAQTIRNSGEALLSIVNDILDFSKIEAGMLEVEETDFAVRAVVDDVTDLLAASAHGKGIELVSMVDPATPQMVNGDGGHLRQVLINLVGNAIKFTPQGEVLLRATMGDPDDNGTTIRFEVADTGEGIAPDKIGAIFQPFVQTDASISRTHGGTGLGLAICGQLITLMGGEYGVSSRPGEGSTFWFTITVRISDRDDLHSSIPSDAGFGGVKALVVDDNDSARAALTQTLMAWGVRVVPVAGGQAALRELRKGVDEEAPFAVVLVDRFMPEMDAIALNRAIAADPDIRAPQVLMIGLGQDAQEDQEELAGFSDVLSKPVHREHLQASLEKALELGRDPTAPKESAERQSEAISDSQVGRLLLAEDNLINQKVAVAMLTSVGYEVDPVPDGAAAVLANDSHRYDAILMDCEMPEMNGYEATHAIRKQQTTDRRIPIIAMTAGARPEDRERCLSEGMDYYLAKPVTKDKLVSLVSAVIRKDRLLSSLAH